MLVKGQAVWLLVKFLELGVKPMREPVVIDGTGTLTMTEQSGWEAGVAQRKEPADWARFAELFEQILRNVERVIQGKPREVTAGEGPS